MYGGTGIDRTYRDFPTVEDRAARGESPISVADFTVGVSEVVRAIEGHPAWDRYGPRKEGYAHTQMADLWVRYNAWENYDPETGLEAFNQPHRSVWYPVAADVPVLRYLVYDVLRHLTLCELGGVLITKIPPGGRVLPHVDGGWHAGYYRNKYAVQLKGNADQSFNFEGCSLSANPGQVYWFDNSKLHWVDNDSNEERITMIICTREFT